MSIEIHFNFWILCWC